MHSDVDISKLKTVCLTLGPYRNLTTLTASLLALHPRCQVLNHAGERIYKEGKLRFLEAYEDKTFDEFVEHAIITSMSGRRGDYGGSIIFSHAFEDPDIQAAYQSRYGYGMCKKVVECLFWKEPLLIGNYIRQNNIDLGYIFSKNKKLRFMMPVRNPMDCAISNAKTGHMRRFEYLDRTSTLRNVLDSILNEYLWFLELSQVYPERFFYYYEHSFNEKVASDVAAFLQLEPETEWLKTVMSNYKIKSGYEHHPDMVMYYREAIRKHFMPYPDVLRSLEAFAQA